MIALALATPCSLVANYIKVGDFITLVISSVIFFAIYGLVLLVMKEELLTELIGQFTGKLKKKRV